MSRAPASGASAPSPRRSPLDSDPAVDPPLRVPDGYEPVLDLRTTEQAIKHVKKAELYFQRRLLAGELPQTVGGGIGQSRLCMVVLDEAHVGEVQASVWPEAMRAACEERGIPLL